MTPGPQNLTCTKSGNYSNMFRIFERCWKLTLFTVPFLAIFGLFKFSCLGGLTKVWLRSNVCQKCSFCVFFSEYAKISKVWIIKIGGSPPPQGLKWLLDRLFSAFWKINFWDLWHPVKFKNVLNLTSHQPILKNLD